MKIYPRVHHLLEEISTVISSKVTIVDKTDIYHALMSAILLDGVTVAPNVVLSLDELEDVLRDLATKPAQSEDSAPVELPPEDQFTASLDDEPIA